MKLLTSIFLLVAVFLCSCRSPDRDPQLLGTWETGIIPSEWGPSKITVTYFPDGRIFGTNQFVEAHSNLGWTGDYFVHDQTLIRTINGRSEEISYRISGDTMKQTFGNETYVFKRKITEQTRAVNAATRRD